MRRTDADKLLGLQRAVDEFEANVAKLGSPVARALAFVDAWREPYTDADVAECAVTVAAEMRQSNAARSSRRTRTENAADLRAVVRTRARALRKKQPARSLDELARDLEDDPEIGRSASYIRRLLKRLDDD